MAINIIDIWKSKGQILEGITNSIFKKADVEAVAADRQAICKINLCGYYDAKGEMESAVYPGQESCGACGCKLSWKVRSMSADCGLAKLNLIPLWTKVMTQEEADLLDEKLLDNV